jgi:hypothetical protein
MAQVNSNNSSFQDDFVFAWIFHFKVIFCGKEVQLYKMEIRNGFCLNGLTGVKTK